MVPGVYVVVPQFGYPVGLLPRRRERLDFLRPIQGMVADVAPQADLVSGFLCMCAQVPPLRLWPVSVRRVVDEPIVTLAGYLNCDPDLMVKGGRKTAPRPDSTLASRLASQISKPAWIASLQYQTNVSHRIPPRFSGGKSLSYRLPRSFRITGHTSYGHTSC